MELKFDEKGLIPAIVQDHYTKQVLTLAYMNAETLALTIAEGRTVFWSRSRQEIWRKGETSGNVQRVVSITADCDADALVVEVVKDGPACHTGAESCFFNEVYVSPELKQFSWQGLYNLIKGRKDTPTEGSYTTYLFEKGKEKILKKVGEECTEVIIAGEKEDKAETVYEILSLIHRCGHHRRGCDPGAGKAPCHRPQGQAGKDAVRSLWQITENPAYIATLPCVTARTPCRRWRVPPVRRG